MTTYARRLGLFSGTMAVIGGIIGGGIFRTPAAVAERLGSPTLILAAWATGGVVALIGAGCFGELGQRRPRAGGGYVYLRETWGALPAFLYGWALLLVIASGAIAAIAVTFADYALLLTGLPARFTRPLAITAILFTPAAFGAALVPILFTYGGWQQTNFIAEEMSDPERDLPRALVLGVGAVIVVYLLANLAYLHALGAAGLAASTAPAADAMRAILGPAGGTLIAAGIAVSTFGFLGLVVLVTPRVFQAMAADGVFFPRLARLHPVHRTPGAAIGLQAVWASALVSSGSFAQLVDYVAFADWIFFGLTVSSLFIYRMRERSTGEAPRAGAFRVPGYPWTPAVFVAAALLVVASSIAANPRNAVIGTGLLALGIPVYGYWSRRQRPSR